MKGQDNMIYVGIDVASKKHDCFIMRDTGEVFSKKSFTILNDIEGYKKLHNSIKEFVESTKDSNVRIVLESTGHYCKNILLYLIKQGYQTTLINPILTNMDRKASSVRKTKTDSIDAEAICRFLDKNRLDFKPYTLLSYHTQALKSLTRQRFSLVKQQTAQKLIFQRLLNVIFPEFSTLFSSVYGESSLNILYSYPTPKKLARAHISSIGKLLHHNSNITAIEIIEAAEIGDIHNFNSPNQLLAYAGLDPSVYESGDFSSSNNKPSKRGSKYLRWAIHQVSSCI